MTRSARRWTAAWFLAPAVLIIGLLVVYPIGWTAWLSLHDATGERWAGTANYADLVGTPQIRRAVLNNAVWIVAAPNLVTAVGLVVAVLAQRVRRATAVRVVLFMPTAIALVAAGITFRLFYDQSPERGVLNAVVVGVHDTFRPPSRYHGARPGALQQQMRSFPSDVDVVAPGAIVDVGAAARVLRVPAVLPAERARRIRPITAT
ncbi:sugar ABC transporter permease [Dactylosporangium sp. NPDC000244]|uniref:carbohydrate ABC transporter permease n=1 Tax=Dactylosporangium sp. NPDC000244 TaxID=3154365 RepID=UPI003331A089